MLVTFPDGAEAVVARVHVRLRNWAPGVYPVGVEVRMIPEPGDRLEAALKADWAHVEPRE